MLEQFSAELPADAAAGPPREWRVNFYRTNFFGYGALLLSQTAARGTALCVLAAAGPPN